MSISSLASSAFSVPTQTISSAGWWTRQRTCDERRDAARGHRLDDDHGLLTAQIIRCTQSISICIRKPCAFVDLNVSGDIEARFIGIDRHFGHVRGETRDHAALADHLEEASMLRMVRVVRSQSASVVA